MDAPPRQCRCETKHQKSHARSRCAASAEMSVKQIATITVIGRDKTGVVARITNFLFEQHANIEALEEQVTRGQFSMTLQASWPKKNFEASKVREGLAGLGTLLGMEIKVR